MRREPQSAGILLTLKFAKNNVRWWSEDKKIKITAVEAAKNEDQKM
jgi:hypothetical protein